MNLFSLRPQSSALSHEGCVRARNEDSFLADERSGLWAVTDGMGGHERGDWASAVIVEELGRPLAASGFEQACGEIAERIHQANHLIYEQAEAHGTQMGSTVVALYVEDRRFAIFWVGDSRAYLLRNRKLYQLSKDHSQVQEMLDRGLLAPEAVNDHPMSHILARAVGVTGEVEVDVIQDELEAGDTFLLCSDGLHGYVQDDDIVGKLGGFPIEGVAHGLVDLTIERGAPDNVTVVVVRFAEPTLLALPGGGGE